MRIVFTRRRLSNISAYVSCGSICVVASLSSIRISPVFFLFSGLGTTLKRVTNFLLNSIQSASGAAATCALQLPVAPANFTRIVALARVALWRASRCSNTRISLKQRVRDVVSILRRGRKVYPFRYIRERSPSKLSFEKIFHGLHVVIRRGNAFVPFFFDLLDDTRILDRYV